MSWRDWITGRGREVTTEALEQTQATFEVDTSSIDPSLFGLPSWTSTTISTAPRVSRELAIQVSSVKRSRDLIAGTLGTLPLELLGPNYSRSRSSLFDQPEPDVPRSVTLTKTIEDLFFEGVAWWLVTERGFHGYPTKVRRLDPRTVNVTRDSKVYVTRSGNSGVTPGWKPDADLIRFDSPTDPLLGAAARAIRAAAIIAKAGENAVDGTPPVDYFTPAEGADPADDDDITQILNDWLEARRQRSTGYVPAALKYNIAGWNPEQLQLGDLLRSAHLEVANHAGVDPEDIGISTTSRVYANQFDRRKQFTDFTLGQYRQAFEDRLSMPDVTPRGFTAQLNLSAFLRSDDKTRYESYQLGVAVGAIDGTREVREMEGKPPLKTEQAEPQPMTPTEAIAADVTNVIRLNFDHDEPLTFDMAAAAAVQVDPEARTITGRLVPYNVVGYNRGRQWVFSQGSLYWDDNDASRVKLWIRHDPDTACGFAAELDDRPDGLYGTFKIANTPDGDRALQLAGEDRVLDAFSIGINPARPGKFVERNGITYAVSMPLMETSLTPAPVYAGARVHAVAASATPEGTTKMKPEQRARLAALRAQETAFSAAEQVEYDALVALESAHPTANFDSTQSPAAPSPVAGQGDFTPEGMTEAIAAGFSAALEQLGAPAVIPAGNVQVTGEPAPYRFDGTRGEHEFSSDLFAAIRFGDGEANQRVQEFIANHFEEAAFAVATTDVDEVNPVRQRPDMFVDYVPGGTPVYDALFSGGLTDATPFIIPTYASDQYLVNDHAEGSAPSNKGAFTTSKVTVTPAALSAETEINREVIDAGGNPQVSGMIWRQSIRRFYESLEAKAAAVLTGATVSELGASIAAGSSPEALADAVEAGLIDLQFVNGAERFDTFLGHVELYKGMGNARQSTTVLDSEDTPVDVVTGNKRYPIINPQNTSGQARSRFRSLDVAGYDLTPAKALGASGTSQKSFVLASEAAHIWNSQPQRIDWTISVAKVNLGLFAYYATAITNAALIRKVTYDSTE